MPENEKAEAQTVLDQLWKEHLIPFPLNVGKITVDTDEHTIHFHDSRIRTVHIPLGAGHQFVEKVRLAVLEGVAKMSGPLASPATAKMGS
jgi:hypothetical protein